MQRRRSGLPPGRRHAPRRAPRGGGQFPRGGFRGVTLLIELLYERPLLLDFGRAGFPAVRRCDPRLVELRAEGGQFPRDGFRGVTLLLELLFERLLLLDLCRGGFRCL